MRQELMIRTYQKADCEQMITLFQNTVHTVNVDCYSKEEVMAWASATKSLDDWHKRFQEQYVLLAFYGQTLVGFGTIKEDYLDYLYVHKDHQREQIGRVLIAQLEAYARLHHHTVLYTDASLSARMFFEQMGYQIVQQQAVVRHGITLKNYRMQKRLMTKELSK